PALVAMLVVIFAVRETHHRGVTKADAAEKLDARAKSDAVEVGGRGASAVVEKPRLTLRGFDGNLKWFLALVALFTLSNSTDAFLIRRAQQAGVSIGQGTLLLWAALHISKVVSSVVGGDLSDRLGRKTLI